MIVLLSELVCWLWKSLSNHVDKFINYMVKILNWNFMRVAFSLRYMHSLAKFHVLSKFMIGHKKIVMTVRVTCVVVTPPIRRFCLFYLFIWSFVCIRITFRMVAHATHVTLIESFCVFIYFKCIIWLTFLNMISAFIRIIEQACMVSDHK